MARKWTIPGLIAMGIIVSLMLLSHWRGQASQSYSSNNIGQFARAMHIYAAQNEGQWPDSLQAIVEKGMQARYDPSMGVLFNPQRPNMKPAYVYLKPAMPVNQVDNPARMIFMHEAYDQWGPGINVGFLDGHVTFISDQAEFSKLLAESKTAMASNGWAWLATTQGSPTTQPAAPAWK